MIEAAVSAGIALLAATAAFSKHVNTKISDLDSRLDRFELRAAQTYVQKPEYFAAINKLEEHMIRIETKIDKLLL
tara:strand:- start:740 stop:964 length:225 start_codon:yes stop_codon:yes gene_type:complete